MAPAYQGRDAVLKDIDEAIAFLARAQKEITGSGRLLAGEADLRMAKSRIGRALHTTTLMG